MAPYMTVRFGLGNPQGMRSDSWSIRSWNDGSIYITPRMLSKSHRGAYKVSLHPKFPDGSGGRWKIEWVDAYVEKHPEVVPDGNTVIQEWESEDVRLRPGVPIRQGFAVVLGRFSLGPHIENDDPNRTASESAHLAKAGWERNLPDPDHAYQWTVLVGDPGVVITPPGTRSMGATHVGTLQLGPNGVAHVMRHVIPLTDRMREQQRIQATGMANTLLEKDEDGNIASKSADDRGRHGVIRGTALGHEEPEGLRWAMEIALPYGFPPGESEAMLNADIAASTN